MVSNTISSVKLDDVRRKLAEKVTVTFGVEHVQAAEFIVNSESGFNPYAQNPNSTAYGIFQFLDSTWESYGCKKTNNIDEQIECGIKYIATRYGNPIQAMYFWQTHGWY